MADLAGGWQTRGQMWRIRRGVVGRHVATRTCSWYRRVVVVDVATGAWNRQVRSSQWKRSRLMVELGVQPVVHRVASIAGSGKFRSHMVDDGCLIILLVTGVASR